ncbi:MAG: hypothetical protein HZB55_05375 [Deltaproteobacteria bacterium]|nr:hypothetical protein [Deltaproteobacteria bacterium]
MNTAKDEVRRLLEDLPDSVSLTDIQYHIDVHQKIERGLDDLSAGRTFTEQDFGKRMSKWLET